MDRGAPEYSQSDPASVAPYAGQQDARSTAYSNSATPTSEYSVYPPTSRSGTFPEMQRQYPPVTNANGGGSAGMPQTPTSPSMPLQDGRSHQSPRQQQAKSDSYIPIDPSIAAASPTYTTHGQYSPYAAPPQDMAAHGYHQHPGTPGLYAQPRPDWGGYGQQAAGHITPTHHVFHQAPATAVPQGRQNQVYSFVPIPGAQQHKRPRRRYEEIERMYRCGWQGCEKAYGTLNHLNAHVTMQGHGPKRVPEEFKEVRRLWKARKKEAEAREKAAEEERQRQAAAAAAAAAQNGGAEQQAPADPAQPPTTYATTGAVQLPPIGFQPRYPGQSTGGIQQQVPEYSYPNYSPTSPYGQSNQQMYNQPNGGQGGGSH
ncbi:uncharacterized protein THITE_2120147 [Thermothielavioides terrestris NRRL 8126]|uniref:C2H2-type domain-containing protein n=1 Tax=Thermothielavioides terrestris (strain ATCC 38088 / NRRL 8126) TaxID=578455 RepID=G2R9L7_THETT|nr:uncharacterized protein THITE_2120147 [Thermothielavioides terrestris NRRL 8126]AEO69561.1 hypothetical protein THITE_2120147 [Thermothielavioides terrestris NRRL 8126]